MLVYCFCRSKGFLEIENVVLRLLLKMIVLREGGIRIKGRGEELGLFSGGSRRVRVIMLLCGGISRRGWKE